ncbi:30S ribosomal protein S3 [archaeon]|nr:30S ribosomal protein S3 [archaeon]|tara:strand:+ start:3460 stop:4317 length:858 start_codon:yes stop_codon:yes gene_type:complete
MIERQFVQQKAKHYRIQELLESKLAKAGFSHAEIKKTPLGEKVVVYTSRPGMVVGQKGENIKALTSILKSKFKMENPQIEVAEIENPFLDAELIAKIIVNSLERFGPKRFKSLGYRTLDDIMKAKALGAEIVISGRGIPSQRSRTWRFSDGYLKKSGDVSETQVRRGHAVAHLKSGAVGIKVSILPPDIKLPDKITYKEDIRKAKEEAEKKAEEKKKEAEKAKEEVKETEEKVEEKKEEAEKKEEIKEEKVEEVKEEKIPKEKKKVKEKKKKDVNTQKKRTKTSK